MSAPKVPQSRSVGDVIAGVLAPCIAQTLGYAVYRLFIYGRYISPLRHLPGPKSSTIVLGEILTQYAPSNPNTAVLGWMQQWPTASLLRIPGIGGTERLIVQSPAGVKDMLQTKCYSSPSRVGFVACWLRRQGWASYSSRKLRSTRCCAEL
jgi:hypothetical protein